MATVTASTSLILVTTSNGNGPYTVKFPNISTTGRIITVRDNDGFASTNNAIVLEAISGATFQGVSGSLTINQPFGFITLNSQANGIYGVLNTFAFPAGSATASVSNITTTNLATQSTIQIRDRTTGVYNTLYTSSGQLILNNSPTGQVSAADLTSTVAGLGTAGYLSTAPLFVSTQFISSLQTNFLSAGTLTVGSFNPTLISTNIVITNVLSTPLVITNVLSAGLTNISSLRTNARRIVLGSNAAAVGVQGIDSVAIGTNAANNTQSQNSVAIGNQAGATLQNSNSVSVGFKAGLFQQGSNAVAIGDEAGAYIQGGRTVAIGANAGSNAQGFGAVAIGDSAGFSAQGTGAVAIGQGASYQTQSDYAIAIGADAGNRVQQLVAVAIGKEAGYSNQGSYAVALGNAAFWNQGGSAIAIGNQTGFSNQKGSAIALGTTAGVYEQKERAIVIGCEGAYSNQGMDAIAIGTQSGYINQGVNAIAIGYQAGYADQSTNTIVLNATGVEFNTTASNATYIKPIRQNLNLNSNMGVLYYISTTGELTYGPTLISTFSTLRTSSLGIGTSTSQYTLDVVGSNRITQFGSATQTAAPTLRVDNVVNGRSIQFYTNLTVGGYTALTSAGDMGLIFTNGTQGTGNLVIAPWVGFSGGMKLTSNGCVGINTVSPTFALDVVSTFRVSSNADNFMTVSYGGGVGAIELKGTSGAYLDIGRSNVDYDVRLIYQSPNTYAEITTSASSGSNIVLNPGSGTARVGINTTTPGFTLDVNGSGRFVGSLSKGSGSFEINHPILENSTLVHSFIEGPRCDLIYRGKKQLSSGIATIDLEKESTGNGASMAPGTFVALCTNPQTYLQNNETFDRVIGSVSTNILTIRSENIESKATIDWMVIAERHDPFIKTWNRTDSNGLLILEHAKV